jgi:hypothetical protein
MRRLLRVRKEKRQAASVVTCLREFLCRKRLIGLASDPDDQAVTGLSDIRNFFSSK